jgi:putative transposase
MSRKTPFENNEYYHVFNRGVEKRKIFLDEDDYSYFVHILDIFNDKLPAHNTRYYYRSRTSIERRDRIVELISYSLLPNHFHLLVKQIDDNGISNFLQKIGVGYTHYFNKKYKRTGVLFQGKSKSRHVNTDRYLNYLKMYIELNPLDLFEPNWKEKGIMDKRKAHEFLSNYKWKSKTKNDRLEEFFVSQAEFLDYINYIEVGLR